MITPVIFSLFILYEIRIVSSCYKFFMSNSTFASIKANLFLLSINLSSAKIRPFETFTNPFYRIRYIIR